MGSVGGSLEWVLLDSSGPRPLLGCSHMVTRARKVRGPRSWGLLDIPLSPCHLTTSMQFLLLGGFRLLHSRVASVQLGFVQAFKNKYFS